MADEEEKHMEGFGDDYEALWGEDFMAILAEEFGAARDLKPTAFKREDGKELVRLRDEPDPGRVGMKYLLERSPGQKKFAFSFAYPVFPGTVAEVRIKDLYPWKGGLAGEVAFSLADQDFTVLLEDFFVDHYRLEPGMTAKLELYGVGLVCKEGERHEFTIKEGPLYEEGLKRFIGENPGKSERDYEGAKVVLDHAVIVFPGMADTYFELRSPVTEVRSLPFCGGELLQLQTVLVAGEDTPSDEEGDAATVARFGRLREDKSGNPVPVQMPRTGLVIPIYASKAVLGSWKPQAGQNVEGVVRLGARLVCDRKDS
ncbi:MAG: hypothetical protein MR009_01040 [Sutterellaceae bacterium]|nr:hypothetical protein [Sutterellaceae bacterium]MDD7441493.1 hypothetical protein [Sutterellaceae bacterium]MDY2867846.1 hypothetical protein [Mesosutterella sp.]